MMSTIELFGGYADGAVFPNVEHCPDTLYFTPAPSAPLEWTDGRPISPQDLQSLNEVPPTLVYRLEGRIGDKVIYRSA